MPIEITGEYVFEVENGKAQAANFLFCTIEPNVGIVAVPDPCLNVLSDLSNSQRVVPASLELVDIAGLVKGANQGEGLGKKIRVKYLRGGLHTSVRKARGLAYLHEESRPRTVHRDVNASNILLDAELCLNGTNIYMQIKEFWSTNIDLHLHCSAAGQRCMYRSRRLLG